MSDDVWYRRYEHYKEEALELQQNFVSRCQQLGVNPDDVLREVQLEIIARAVHESNWQEGIYVEEAQTRILTLDAFNDSAQNIGPRLDMAGILKAHTEKVDSFKKRGMPIEYIATYNLAVAHVAVTMIGYELLARHTATLVGPMREIIRLEAETKSIDSIVDDEARERMRKVYQDMIDSLENAYRTAFPFPLTEPIPTHKELFDKLLESDPKLLKKPLRVEHIHFLHSIVMTGILPRNERGVFRRESVTVNDPNVSFPVPSLVPPLMERFCNSFPPIMPGITKYDSILKAAEVSYRFVRIHPYVDGNGRVSRLLMNLVLWYTFPPVYLKADRKGRRKYALALHRANRNDIKPLACLIAISLRSIYERLLQTLDQSLGS